MKRITKKAILLRIAFDLGKDSDAYRWAKELPAKELIDEVGSVQGWTIADEDGFACQDRSEA